MSNDYKEAESPKKPKSGLTAAIKAKLAVVFMLFSMALMAAPAAAGQLNDTISPILEDVASIFTPLLTLIIAVIPLIIAVSLIGFVLGIFDAVIHKIKL
jgi:hypothetical protein